MPGLSYFQGCSNGGRQALIEAQRYPADFNGIIAESPVLDQMGALLGYSWKAQAAQMRPFRRTRCPSWRMPCSRNATPKTACKMASSVIRGVAGLTRKACSASWRSGAPHSARQQEVDVLSVIGYIRCPLMDNPLEVQQRLQAFPPVVPPACCGAKKEPEQRLLKSLTSPGGLAIVIMC